MVYRKKNSTYEHAKTEVARMLPVSLKRSRLKPRQYNSTTGMIIASIVAVVLVAILIYTVLVIARIMPVPAFIMTGDTKPVGTTLVQATSFDKIERPDESSFTSPEAAESYLAFHNAFEEAMNPSIDAYQALAAELSRPGIPDLKRIQEKANHAKSETQLSRQALDKIEIPEDLGNNNLKTLSSSVNTAVKYLDYGGKLTTHVISGTNGSISNFGYAENDAYNMLRYRTSIVSSINEVQSGLIVQEEVLEEGAEVSE